MEECSVLVIGDPHFKDDPSVLLDNKLMVDSILSKINVKLDFIVVLGDLLHDNNICHIEPYDMSTRPHRARSLAMSLPLRLTSSLPGNSGCKAHSSRTSTAPWHSAARVLRRIARLKQSTPSKLRI